MEEELIEVSNADTLNEILQELVNIRGCLEYMSTLFFLVVVVLGALGLVYMCYSLLRKFM